MKVLVTGGAGFIGSSVIRKMIGEEGLAVVNVDKLTYAGNLATIASVADSSLYEFEKVDICDTSAIVRIFTAHRPDAVMHLAAESHVDRSIEGPRAFIDTNLVGTYVMLDAARSYWLSLDDEAKEKFRFHHVSTDEVFGSLGDEGLFSEDSPYSPNSPYSASKAGADHLVRAWHETYGLPVLVTNCSNNYGPFQYPEKLIPLLITKALHGEPLPIYGSGENVRDWLYVDDHADALLTVLRHGAVGETYMIGGNNERTNLEIVHQVCAILDELLPNSKHRPHKNLIEYVEDRPGHDHRYAISPEKIEQQLGWHSAESLESGLKKTVAWYLENQDWCKNALADNYDRGRLGLTK